MAYTLDQTKSVESELRRIAVEQIDRALREIDGECGIDETVHQVRKRCKKVRGLLRLVRGALPREVYKAENQRFRDAARRLSPFRDATAALETFEGLVERSPAEPTSLRAIGSHLEQQHDEVVQASSDVERAIELVADELRGARDRAQSWKLEAAGFAALRGGIQKTYGRGRKEMSRAVRTRHPKQFHEWRKRVKYGWYHARLLRGSWPVVLPGVIEAYDALGDVLGDHHDLTVLAEMLQRWDALSRIEPAALTEFRALAGRRQLELEARARSAGLRLFAEKPRAFVARLAVYWAAWHAEGACTNATD